MYETNPAHAAEIGKRWCQKQVEELLNISTCRAFLCSGDVHSIAEIGTKRKIDSVRK